MDQFANIKTYSAAGGVLAKTNITGDQGLPDRS
jgi:hypothetical protein